ncbi:hypothetical protein B0J13DRAFT_609391 [Dactylonectria estremocensis]|uniref:Uncharacterized protein n=1 Tax=Dactylonectria estremocensis TaxID=1079267 RepID=A0A9P9EHQ4_9HYPO|nr:hypothetical protein B0J13DRAFT_609391 [Dactylonectria estremocensis]
MEPSRDHVPSPGNAHNPPGSDVPAMRMPHLDLVYRIVADMDADGISEIPGVDGTSVARVVLPIRGGTVCGPRIKGVIVERSGADWAQVVDPRKTLWRLNANYTLRTDDGVFILVQATGVFRPGPGTPNNVTDKQTVSQDDVEYFTSIRFEAPGGSPYGWMNGIVAIGVMAMWEGKPVIDCYRLTNFPGQLALDIQVKE